MAQSYIFLNLTKKKPGTGAHTNIIEHEWRDLHSRLQKMGWKINYEGHFHRIMFIRSFMNSKVLFMLSGYM